MAKIHRSDNENYFRSSGAHSAGAHSRAYNYEEDQGGMAGRNSASGGRRTAQSRGPRRPVTPPQRPHKRRHISWVAVLQAVASILLVVQIWRTKLIPIWIVGALAIVLLVLWLITFNATRRRGHGMVTRFFAAVLTAAMVIGCVFTQQGIAALQKVTSGKDATVIGVYVLKEDSAKKIEDTEGYSFGCIDQMDRDNTDKAIEQISSKSPSVQNPTGYSSMFELVNELYNGGVQAILLNQSFIEMIEDDEYSYTDFSERTRCIYTFTTVNTPDVLGDGVTGTEAKKIAQDPFIVYLSGVDAREGLPEGGRSDVNIIAAVNPNTKRIVLINTPRDYYVTLAETNGAKDKLTHAGLYGVSRSMETLGTLYNQDIQYYVRINFSGFIGIIDALGGVDVESDYEFTSVGSPDYYDPTTFTKGMNHLDGAAALAFARERHAFPSGDIQRGVNQMKVISAVAKKAQSAAVLKNYSKLMSSISDSFATNLSSDQIGALVQMQLNDNSSWTIESYTVTGSSSSSTECYSDKGHSLYVMTPDESTVATAQSMIDSVMNGEPVADSSSAASGTASAPSVSAG